MRVWNATALVLAKLSPAGTNMRRLAAWPTPRLELSPEHSQAMFPIRLGTALLKLSEECFPGRASIDQLRDAFKVLE